MNLITTQHSNKMISTYSIALSLPVLWFLSYIYTNYLKKTSKCKSDAKLYGKTAIVTGANSGIGLEITLELYRRGARVIMACRNKDRAQKAIDHITSTCQNSNSSMGKLEVYILDLASHKSVREFCELVLENELRIDLLINNAGIYNHPSKCTEDGLEIHMGVNHFSHFLLTNLLMDKLKASSPSRVVVVGSYLYSYGEIDLEKLKKGVLNPNSKEAYNNSKLANALFVRHFSCKYEPKSGVSIFYADPGIARTNIDRYTIPGCIQPFVHLFISAFYRGPQYACQTILHCALSDEVESGCIYADCMKKNWCDQVLDGEEIAKQFWEKSEELTGLCH